MRTMFLGMSVESCTAAYSVIQQRDVKPPLPSLHTQEWKGTLMFMKTILAAAGFVVATLGVSAPASAHDGYYDRGSYDRGYDDRGYGDRDWRDRRDWREHRRWERRHARYDRRYYGWNDRRGRDCWREWHHGRRVRVCNYYR